MIVNVCAPPQPTDTEPLGEIVPCSPAVAVSVSTSFVKLATIVWFAVTFWNVYTAGVPTDAPSTCTSAM